MRQMETNNKHQFIEFLVDSNSYEQKVLGTEKKR